MVDPKEKIELIIDGRSAEFVLAHIGQKITKAKEFQLNRMESAYRTGIFDSTILISGISGYCALKDFESNLIKEIKRGANAVKEEHDRPDDDFNQ